MEKIEIYPISALNSAILDLFTNHIPERKI